MYIRWQYIVPKVKCLPSFLHNNIICSAKKIAARNGGGLARARAIPANFVRAIQRAHITTKGAVFNTYWTL